MSGLKTKYIGKFNNQRELIVKYTHGNCPKNAFYNMCGQIAKDKGMSKASIVNYFLNKPNSYEISIEVEYKEAGE